MNKQELVRIVGRTANVPQNTVEKVLNTIISTVIETVAEGDKVTLVNFGTFEQRGRKERTGHNPKTQEPLVIPATKIPYFSAGKEFKDKVANS